MNYAYANRKRGESAAPKTESAAPQPSMDALRAGFAKPTQEQMGRRVDLPDAMRAKMENAFGADLSAVKLYESEAVADAGANAVAQGSNIAFAPGMLDFTSYGGRALLGHELSHVVSQQRGEVTGNGFLNDHALEARADREGAMAAAGRQIAMPTAAMSFVSTAPAAGPMQASKAENKIAKHQKTQLDTYKAIAQMRQNNPQDYVWSRDYKNAVSSLNSANRWERYWRGKLSPDAQHPASTGMKALDLARQLNSTRDDAGNETSFNEREYMNTASAFIEAMPELAVQGDTALQNRVVEESSAMANRNIKEKIAQSPSISYADVSNAGFRGSAGTTAQKPLGNLMIKMIGANNIENALNTDSSDAAAQGLLDEAERSGVSGLMRRQNQLTFAGLEEKQFNGFTLDAMTRSRMVGQSNLLRLASSVNKNRQDQDAALMPAQERSREFLHAARLGSSNGAFTPANTPAIRKFMQAPGSVSPLTPGKIDAGGADPVLRHCNPNSHVNEVDPSARAAYNRRLRKYTPEGDGSGKRYVGFSVDARDASGQENFERQRALMNHPEADAALAIHEGAKEFSGLNISRIASGLNTINHLDRTEEDFDAMFDDLMAPHEIPESGMTDQFGVKRRDDATRQDQNQRFGRGMHTLKGFYYDYLKMLKGKYGSYLEDMHPEDALRTFPDLKRDFGPLQDWYQMLRDDTPEGGDASQHLFNTRGNQDDKNFRDMVGYLGNQYMKIDVYAKMQGPLRLGSGDDNIPNPNYQSMDANSLAALYDNTNTFKTDEFERPDLSNAPGFSEQDKLAYMEDLRKRSHKSGGKLPLFGKFQ